jgi:hypothetical protein
MALGQVYFGIKETGILALGIVALGQVNFRITETEITGVHSFFFTVL